MKELVEKHNATWAIFAENIDKQVVGNRWLVLVHVRLASKSRRLLRNLGASRLKQVSNNKPAD